MSTNKKSFLLHIDSLDILDDLTHGQAGVLFKAIKAYQHKEEFTIDSVVKIAFSPFKNQFIRDDEKYIKTCEKRAEAGAIGGRANKRDAGIDNHGETQLYVLRLYNENEDFIKIGTTTNRINRRFSGAKNMPYEYEIVHQLIGEDVGLEVSLQSALYEFSYDPLIRFPGHTECFSREGLKKLKEIQPFAQAKGSKTKQELANVADTKNKNKNKTKNDKEVIVTSRFSPPTDIETVEYFLSKQSTNAEAEKFWLFYDSKNWMVGKSKMKKWQSAASGWIKRNGEGSGQINANNANSSKKLSAYERQRERNAVYRNEQPNECELGLGANDRHLRGAMGKGEGGATVNNVGDGTFVDY